MDSYIPNIIEIIIEAIPILVIITFSLYKYYTKNKNKKLKNNSSKITYAKIEEIWISGNILKFSARDADNYYMSNDIIIDTDFSNSEKIHTQDKTLFKDINTNINALKGVKSTLKKLNTIIFIPFAMSMIIIGLAIIIDSLVNSDNERTITGAIILILGIVLIKIAIKNIKDLKNKKGQKERIYEGNKEQYNINGVELKPGYPVTVYINPKNSNDYRIDTDFLYSK